MDSATIFFPVKDADDLILSFLNYQNLRKILVTKAIPDQRRFWEERIKQNYSSLIVSRLTMEECKKLYRLLERDIAVELINYATENDFPELVEYMIFKKRSIFTAGVNLLAKHGKLDALKQSPYVMPDNIGLALAIGNKHFDLVNWLAEEKQIKPNCREFIRLGYFDEAKYFRNSDERWYQEMSREKDTIIEHNRLDILELLAEKQSFPTSNDLNIAALHGHYDIVEWASIYKLYPNSVGCNLALINEHYNIVTFLMNNDINPTNFAFGHLLTKNRFDDVKLLLNLGLVPRVDHIGYANEKGFDKIIELFIIYGYITKRFPTKFFQIEELFDLYDL